MFTEKHTQNDKHYDLEATIFFIYYKHFEVIKYSSTKQFF